MRRFTPVGSAALALGMFVLALGTVQGAFLTFSAGGDTNAASIQATVDAFRAALGNPNNANAPGPLPAGRREINWDAGGAVLATVSGSPLTSFADSRGASFTTPGTSFLQTPLTAPELAALNPAYATTFGFSSPLRVFTPLGANVTDVTFSIPGTNGAVAATVGGFGAVFSDVDLADTTRLQFFDVNQALLFSAFAPVGLTPSASLSFLGALANAGEQIARVRITTGNSSLGPIDSLATDVVVMDDVVYSEPVPEPTSAAMTLAGLLAMVRWRR